MWWNKYFFQAILGYLLLVAFAQAAENPIKKPLYECPRYFHLDSSPYGLRGVTVFDGPVEEAASQVPEAVPDTEEPDFLRYTASKDRTLYVKCIYEDIRHYIVLEAEGAKQCIQRATVYNAIVQCD